MTAEIRACDPRQVGGLEIAAPWKHETWHFTENISNGGPVLLSNLTG